MTKFFTVISSNFTSMSLKDLHLPLLDMMARVLAPGGVILSWTARSRGPGDRGLVEVSTVICPYGPPRRYWTAEGTEIDVFSRGLTYEINIYTYIQYILACCSNTFLEGFFRVYLRGIWESYLTMFFATFNSYNCQIQLLFLLNLTLLLAKFNSYFCQI